MKKAWPLLLLLLVLLLPRNCRLSQSGFALSPGKQLQELSVSGFAGQISDQLEVDLDEVYFSDNLWLVFDKSGKIDKFFGWFTVPGVKLTFDSYELSNGRANLRQRNIEDIENYRVPADKLLSVLEATAWEPLLDSFPASELYCLELSQYQWNFDPGKLNSDFETAVYIKNGQVVRGDLKSPGLDWDTPTLVFEFFTVAADDEEAMFENLTRDLLLLR